MSTQVLEPQVQTTIKVTKAKLTKAGGLEISFDKTAVFEKEGETTESFSEDNSKCNSFPHPDLVQCFDLMKPHLAILCDLREAYKRELMELTDNPELLENIRVTGFSIGGSGEHEGVTLVGQKKLRGGKILNLICPFTKWQDENDQYDYSVELEGLIDHTCDEVISYMNGKVAPSAQLEMQFDGEETDEELE